jgi:hypothetical protein
MIQVANFNLEQNQLQIGTKLLPIGTQAVVLTMRAKLIV